MTLEKLRQAQTLSVGDASRLAKQEKELTSEVSQLRTQLVQQASAHSLLGRELKQSGVDTTKSWHPGNIATCNVK